MNFLVKMEEIGWHPNRPSNECLALTAQFAGSVRRNLILTEVDRVAIVRSLVVLELNVRVGKFADDDLEEQDLEQKVIRIAVWHALLALGHARQEEDGGWRISPETELEWADRLNSWDTGRRAEVSKRWDDVNDRGAYHEVEENPERFEPLLTQMKLEDALGYLPSPKSQVQVVRKVLENIYPDGEGPVTLKEMPQFLDLVRRTASGKERRLTYPANGSLNLGQEEVERGLEGIFRADDSPSPISINAPLDATGKELEPEADEDSDPVQVVIMWQQSRRALDALAEIKASAGEGTGEALVLEPENLIFLRAGGTFAELARRTGMGESTIREAYDRVVEAVQRRLTG